MGTQKNGLNESVRLNKMVLLSTQNICLKLCVRQYSQFNAEHVCLSKPASDVDDADQTACLRRLVCTFIVHMQFTKFI